MVNPILILAVPLLIAFLIPLWKKSGKILVLLTTVFNIYVITGLFSKVLHNPIIVEIGGWQAPLGINLYVDGLALGAVLIVNIVGLLLAVYNLKYSNFPAGDKFQILFLLVLAGASGIIMTGDIFNLFVFIEITAIATYGLTTFGKGEGFEAAFKYIMIGSIGSVFLLAAIGFTYASLGTLNMAEIARMSHLLDPRLLRVITLLFFIGIGIEAELFPLNFWVADVYSAAPIQVSSVLSGAVSLAGVFALGRIFFTLFNDPGLYVYLMVIGLITLIVGELIAFQQDNIKRMLAYSSVAQMGLVVAVISLKTDLAVTAGLFQLLNHSLIKVLLFITAGMMTRAVASNRIDDLSGMGRRLPLASLGFTVGAMGLLGVPFFNGFISKLMIVNSSLNAGKYILTAAILLATVIELGYYLKVIQRLYFTTGKETGLNQVGLTYLVPVVVLVVLVISIGVYPQLITDHLSTFASQLLDRSGYIASVLGGV